MKKKILIASILVVIIMVLSGSFMGRNRTSADVIKAEPEGNGLIGAWYLSDYTDYEALNEAFPDVYAFGSELLIRPDGKISWNIGAAGAAGTYEVYDNQLIATVADIMEYDERDIVITQDEYGRLSMKYKSVPLEWIYGGDIVY